MSYNPRKRHPCRSSKVFHQGLENKWAVYLLVLEKPNCRSRIYVGSGTEQIRGVAYRFNQYNTQTGLPKFIKKSPDEGYTIQHKGLLCWSSLPQAADVPITRLVFVALEATFTHVFWALRGQTDLGYSMTGMFAWARDSLEYDGCCSHNSLSETFAGDLGMSAEDLEAKMLEQTRKKLAYIKQWRQNKTNGPNGAAYKA